MLRFHLYPTLWRVTELRVIYFKCQLHCLGFGLFSGIWNLLDLSFLNHILISCKLSKSIYFECHCGHVRPIIVWAPHVGHVPSFVMWNKMFLGKYINGLSEKLQGCEVWDHNEVDTPCHFLNFIRNSLLAIYNWNVHSKVEPPFAIIVCYTVDGPCVHSAHSQICLHVLSCIYLFH